MKYYILKNKSTYGMYFPLMGKYHNLASCDLLPLAILIFKQGSPIPRICVRILKS